MTSAVKSNFVRIRVVIPPWLPGCFLRERLLRTRHAVARIGLILSVVTVRQHGEYFNGFPDAGSVFIYGLFSNFSTRNKTIPGDSISLSWYFVCVT